MNYKTFPPSKIYVSKSEVGSGERGVFANQEIQKGEVIERCPFIEVPKEELESVENTIFVNYIYFFGVKKERVLLALGFGSIYNHSYTPNAAYKIIASKKVIEFSALKNIKRGEEIFVNYNQESPNSNPLWFE